MDAFELRKKSFAFFEFQPQKTDKAMTIILGRLVLDLSEFDDFLHYKHGNYESEGFSMETLIKEKYGKEALDFSLEAFGINVGGTSK